MSKLKPGTILSPLAVTDIADKGRGLARHEGRVVFIEGAVPGDLVEARTLKSKSSFADAVMTQLLEPSPDRRQPYCPHFSDCGGCRWQHLSYEAQLRHKHKQVVNALERIGHLKLPQVNYILGSALEEGYRNKLEYSFSSHRWLTEDDAARQASGQEVSLDTLGYHAPGRFDKVLDIGICFHQPDPSNAIRDKAKSLAFEMGLPFYDTKRQESGYLRSLMLRNTLTGDWMVVLQVAQEKPEWLHPYLDGLIAAFPQVANWMYAINEKKNDSLYDLDVHAYKGPGFLEEEMEGLRFRIGPKSFYQTNPSQAKRLYEVARRMAALTGQELVYDLYTGTGTIALFVARQAREVIGIEYVEQAVEDARANAERNGIGHARFFAGDMAKLLTSDFIDHEGRPDIIITDPPRAGMHADVVQAIRYAAPKRIVYVSCNPATQARDLALLDEDYAITHVQPVDMFPQTDHVECVVALERR